MRTIKITPQNARYWHRRLWLWLAKNPGCYKEDWPGWKYIESTNNCCFACEIAIRKQRETQHQNKCEFCPIKNWRTAPSPKKSTTGCYYKEYGKWETAIIYQTPPPDLRYEAQTHWAEIIANLEWEIV